MIHIEQGRTHLSVTGHAGYAPKGQDIICAAVSALTVSLILSLKELTKDRIYESVNPGRIKIEYKDLSEAGQLLMSSFLISVQNIAQGNPEYVEVFIN